MVLSRERAKRCRMISVSLVVLKMEPSRRSSSRIRRQLANWPLWAMATMPFCVSATNGWAFSMVEEPCVE